MFEAIAVICAVSGEPCREALYPGYEAPTEAACVAALSANPPEGLTGAGAPRCQPVGPALPVTEVASGIFVHEGKIEEPNSDNRGDVSNLGFVVGSNGVAVIDSGAARWIGEALWRAIRQVTDAPVTHVVLTHMHPDHVFGASPLAETGAQIVAHESLTRALADRAENYLASLERLIGAPDFLGTRSVSVDLPVADRGRIDLGDRVLELRAWPMAHTGTDLTVRDSATGTLFAGDLVFHRHSPALDGSLRGWQAALATIAKQDVTRLVPGHGDAALEWPEGLAALQRYLDVLARDTAEAIAEGRRLGDAVETIGASEAPHWELFDAYNPRNATVAFTELEWE